MPASLVAAGVTALFVPAGPTAGAVALAAWAVGTAALLAITLATARPPAGAVPGLDGYLDRWGALHGGYDPRANRWVRGWLACAYRAGLPFARWGVAPDLVTLWGAWVALAVAAVAAVGGRWLLLAAGLVVVGALADALDGVVAVLTGRVTRWGYVLDSVVDRVSDVLYVVALWLAGGIAGIAVAAGVAFGMLEYLRARAGNAGMGEIGVVTVGERATRVICCAAGLLAAGAAPARAGVLATAALAVLAVLSTVGVAQLAVVARRRLSAGE